MITVDQIQELYNIVRDNHSIFVLNSLGSDYLSEEDKDRLKTIGIDLSLEKTSFIYDSFFLGVLSDTLGKLETEKRLSYQDIKDYVKKGQYLPLTQKELFTLKSIENQCLKDIKGLQGKIFSDINQIVLNNTKIGQENFLKENIKEGVLNKKTNEEISRDLSHKTGDWSRDFDRIVQFTTQTAYEEGKSLSIEKYSDQEDPDVYKVVYNEACRHCIRLYLTKGIGSEPKIFKLSELRLNGTNIGRKVDDWKPVIGPTHPYCRCNLMEKRRGESWNSEEKQFILDKEKLNSLSKRKRVKIVINNKEFIG